MLSDVSNSGQCYRYSLQTILNSDKDNSFRILSGFYIFLPFSRNMLRFRKATRFDLNAFLKSICFTFENL